jgi:hypothetical protein
MKTRNRPPKATSSKRDPSLPRKTSRPGPKTRLPLAFLGIRLERLRLLIEQCGGQTELAAKLGYANPSFISQMLKGHCTIGDKAARTIEHKLDLPNGWMDIDDRIDLAGKPVNTMLFKDIVALVITVIEEFNQPLTAEQLTTIVTLSYAEALKIDGRFNKAFIERLANLAPHARTFAFSR